MFRGRDQKAGTEVVVLWPAEAISPFSGTILNDASLGSDNSSDYVARIKSEKRDNKP